MAIDARENINAQIYLARSLGGDIGSAFGYRQREKRRERMELALIQIVGDSNMNASQKRQAMLMTADLLNSGIGEEVVQAELGIGRHYESPLDTEYKKARIDATKALTKSRTGDGNLLSQLKYWQDSFDKATMSGDQRTTKYATSRIDKILIALDQPGDMSVDAGMGSGAADTSGGGLPTGPPGSKADIMQGAFGRPNLTGPPASLQSQGLQIGSFQDPSSAPMSPDTGESLPTAEELIGPPASAQANFPIPTPGLEKRSSPPEPKTQAEFEATVRRMGHSEATRRYYQKWVHKWQ